MARPQKKGLDYFPFDTDFFEDKKIRALKGKYGSDGVTAYVYILCKIYADKGYYTVLDEDFILCMSDDLNITEDSTRQILKYLFSRSLLCEIKDSTLAKSVTVITAESIQRRYQEAKKGCKKDIEVAAKLWVLKENETLSFIKVRPENGFSEINAGFSEKNSLKSKKNAIKESKVKKSKLKESKGNNGGSDEPKNPPARAYGEFAHVRLTDEQYHKLISDYGESTVKLYIRKIDEYCQMHGRSYNDYELTVRNWIKADNDKNNSDGKYHEDDFDINKYYSLMNKF